MDVVSIGEALIDFIPGREKNSYIKNPGGAPANFSVGIARNNLESGFIGKLGDDDFGRFIEETLKSNGVKILVKEKTKKYTTTMAFVSLNENGERSFTFARKPGADMFLTKEDIDLESIKSCKVIHAGSFSLSQETAKSSTVFAMKKAKEYKKLLSFDVNYRNHVWESKKDAIEETKKIFEYVDLLKISDEERDFLGEDIFAFMKKYSVSLVVETFGKDGAKAFFDGEIIDGGKVDVKAVDTTGAGDAFWSAFISKLLTEKVEKTSDLNREIIKKALDYALISGAITVTKYGAIPALPAKEEIESFKR